MENLFPEIPAESAGLLTPGNERKAFYNDLAPRNYRLRFAACNNSGVWNEGGAFLDLAIDPAYYQTTWFRLLSCVKKYKPGPR